MLRLTRFTSPMVTLPRVALALTLTAAVACADRAATAPQHATQRASSDIIPPTNPFDDLWVSPHREVVAGYSATGFVTMHMPAPPGGAHLVLRLAHPTPFVSFDTNLVIPEGDTMKSFLVQTSPEPDHLGISLYADWGTTWRVTGAFNLLPSPSIYVLPATGTLTFGSQAVGTSSAAQIITVQNNGTVQLTLGVIAVSGPFTQTNNCPASLAPGQSCTIWVVYTPTGAGAQSGSVTIPSNAPNSPRVVILNGTGFVPTPGISVTPMAIGWGSVALGNATSGRVVKITSTGNVPLIISSLTPGGTNPGDFPIYTDGCTGASLSPGASCTAYVSFEPQAIGTRTATITIAHNASGGPKVVSLSGTGVKSSGGGGYIP